MLSVEAIEFDARPSIRIPVRNVVGITAADALACANRIAGADQVARANRSGKLLGVASWHR